MHPRERKPGIIGQRPEERDFIGWRLDYMLASKAIAARSQSCVVLADVGTSDHAPVMMTIG